MTALLNSKSLAIIKLNRFSSSENVPDTSEHPGCDSSTGKEVPQSGNENSWTAHPKNCTGAGKFLPWTPAPHHTSGVTAPLVLLLQIFFFFFCSRCKIILISVSVCPLKAPRDFFGNEIMLQTPGCSTTFLDWKEFSLPGVNQGAGADSSSTEGILMEYFIFKVKRREI